MPQIYDMGPTALLPLRREACWGFFRPKNPTSSAGFEHANLGTKGQHATPRPPKPLLYPYNNSETINWLYNRTLWFLVRIKEGVLGVKVHGSRHPMSKSTGTFGWRRFKKGEKQVECASLGGREIEARAGTWNLAVLGTGRCMGFFRQIYLPLNIKLLKCCHFCWEYSSQRYKLMYNHWWPVPPYTYHVYSLR